MGTGNIHDAVPAWNQAPGLTHGVHPREFAQSPESSGPTAASRAPPEQVWANGSQSPPSEPAGARNDRVPGEESSVV